VVDEDIVVPLAGMAMVIVIVIGFPLVRAWVKRIEQGPPASKRSPESDRRLERIEQAIDAMAVEVERISESQRFMTRLLSERTAERVALPHDER
jgi:hypothetical protein